MNQEGGNNLRILIVKDDVYYRIRHLSDYQSQIIDVKASYQDQEDR